MLAIDESTSSDCAREIRGTASIASAVIGRRASSSTRSGFSPGESNPTSVAPSASVSSCSTAGAFTVKTTSVPQASAAEPIRAPAAS
jgi:hypothetical protein